MGWAATGERAVHAGDRSDRGEAGPQRAGDPSEEARAIRAAGAVDATVVHAQRAVQLSHEPADEDHVVLIAVVGLRPGPVGAVGIRIDADEAGRARRLGEAR